MKDIIKIRQGDLEIEYDLLFTVKDDKTNEKFVVYTDNTIDNNGRVKIYLGKYDHDNILPITEKDKEELEKIVDLVQREIQNEKDWWTI